MKDEQAEGLALYRALCAAFLPDWRGADSPETDIAAALLRAYLPLWARTGTLVERMPEKQADYLFGLFGCTARPGQGARGMLRLLPAPDAAPCRLAAGTKFADETGVQFTLDQPALLSANFVRQVVGTAPRQGRRADWTPRGDGAWPVLNFGEGAGVPAPPCVLSLNFADGFFCAGSFALQKRDLPDDAAWTLRRDGQSVPLEAAAAQGALVLHLPVGEAPAFDGPCAIEARWPVNGGVRRALPNELALPAVTRPAEQVWNDEQPADRDDFLPFGERLQPEACCLIACDELLGREGAVITLSGQLSYEQTAWGMELLDAAPPAYRLIMRRLPDSAARTVCHAAVQAVAWEYWDGTVWLPLPDSAALATALAAPAGRLQVRFRRPPGWQRCVWQGQSAFWLRLRLLRADGCFSLPCLHTVPRLRALTLWADGASLFPVQTALAGADALDGAEVEDPPAAFFRFASGAPVRLWLEGAPEKTSFFYAAASTFCPLAAQMTGDGVVTLDFPPDFAQSTHFGTPGYWVRAEGLDGCTVSLVCHPATACAETGTARAGAALRPWEEIPGVQGAEVVRDFAAAIPPETPGALGRRAHHLLFHGDRAVTAADIALLLRDEFPPCADARSAFEPDGVLRIAVLFRTPGQYGHAETLARMRTFLAGRLPVGLGARWRLTLPDWAPLNLCLTVAGLPAGAAPGLQKACDDALARLLAPLADGGRWGEFPARARLEAVFSGVAAGQGAVLVRCEQEPPTESGGAWSLPAAGVLNIQTTGRE